MGTMKKTMTTKKLWLDDERPEPEGWVRVKTAQMAIIHLASGEFDEVSLDHDLGPDDAGTGYHVVCWLEHEAMTNLSFTVPVVHVHTANPSARVKMSLAVENINKARRARKEAIDVATQA